MVKEECQMTLPHAVFGGLVLIAMALYFGAGTNTVGAFPKEMIFKVTICDQHGNNCTNLKHETSSEMRTI